MKTAPEIVRLTPEVAALLAELRRPGESWSDVIGRCARTEREAAESEKPFGTLSSGRRDTGS